jgi:hypothetical protein
MEQSSSWESNSCSVAIEITSIIWKPKAYYHVLLVSFLSHINPIHSLLSYFFKIYLNITITSTHMSSKMLCSFRYKSSIPLYYGSRASVVGIATGYGLDGRGVGVRVPVKSRIFTSPRRPDRLWGPLNLLSNRYRGSFPGGNAARAWSWLLNSN